MPTTQLIFVPNPESEVPAQSITVNEAIDYKPLTIVSFGEKQYEVRKVEDSIVQSSPGIFSSHRTITLHEMPA